tara:strand:+ start:958 stop:1080 length:123 start_codon:yes stop_codon:yes gene_type:complete
VLPAIDDMIPVDGVPEVLSSQIMFLENQFSQVYYDFKDIS